MAGEHSLTTQNVTIDRDSGAQECLAGQPRREGSRIE